MRLREDAVDAIKRAVETRFGPSARVFLFGSRLDDTKSGGDIDLLVEHDERLGAEALEL